MSGSSEPYLEPLRKFLNQECIFRRVISESKYREYRALSCASQWRVLPQHDAAARLWHLNVNVILLKKKHDDYIVSVAFDGRHYKQMLCSKVVSIPFFTLPVPHIKFFKLRFNMFKPMADAFEPTYDQSYIPHVSIPGLVMYDYCTVIHKHLSAPPTPGAKIVPVGNCGVWFYSTGYQPYMVTFALKYDLCVCVWPNPVMFPSFARVLAAAVGCSNAECSYCTGHDKHVGIFDVAGEHGKNAEICLCSIPCAREDWKITNEGLKRLLCKEDIVSIQLETAPANPNVIEPTLGTYFYGVDKDGKKVPLEEQNFMLIRLDPKLSYMMILACPVLKRLCFGL
ncbi:protein U65 [Elephant endotheliotropic herpesvirus 3B]|nr:protein U65 [Elephant endotheliotropic herpesvirus 3B]